MVVAVSVLLLFDDDDDDDLRRHHGLKRMGFESSPANSKCTRQNIIGDVEYPT